MAITHGGDWEANVNPFDGPTTIDWDDTFDIGTLTNGLLVVKFSYKATASLNTLTMKWDGVALTQAVWDDGGSSDPSTSIFYIMNPSNGSNTLEIDGEISFGGSAYYGSVHVSWWNGVHQSAAKDQDETATGTGDPSVDITPSENNELCVCIFLSAQNDVLSVGSGETLLDDHDFGGWVAGSSYAIQSTAGTQTMDWSGTDADVYAIAAASFKEASGAGAQTLTSTAIASGEALGSLTLAGPISATGIAGAEAFGTASLSGGSVEIGLASGISSEEALGDLVVTPGAVSVLADAIASAEAIGSAVLNMQMTAVAIVSSEAFGSHTLTPGAVTISPDGVITGEALGAHELSGGIPGEIAVDSGFGYRIILQPAFED